MEVCVEKNRVLGRVSLAASESIFSRPSSIYRHRCHHRHNFPCCLLRIVLEVGREEGTEEGKFSDPDLGGQTNKNWAKFFPWYILGPSF